jgi:hypothetical protein
MKGRARNKALAFSFILFWLGMMGWLVKRSYFPQRPIYETDRSTTNDDTFPQPHPTATTTSLSSQEEWLGIYFKGTKIGYAFRSLKKIPQGYSLKEVAELKMKLMEAPRQVSLVTAAEVDPEFSLKSFTFKMSSQDTQLAVEGIVRDKSMELSLISGKEVRHEQLLLDQVPQIPVNLPWYLAKKGIKVGHSHQLTFFDPSTLSNDVLTIKVLQRDKIEISGNEVEAYKIEESFKGLVHHAWISREGKILREEAPMGITLIQETREKALKALPEEGAQIDLIYATAVEVNTKLPQPHRLKYLKLKLSNAHLDDFSLSSDRQKLQDNILEIQVEDLSDLAPSDLSFLAREKDRYRKLLEPSPLVQSDHPKIQQLARSILSGEHKGVEAVQRISEWVYSNIEKRPTVSIPSALDVLTARAGDCNEHTVLFTALARAGQIPTRMVAGLLYHDKRFFYHAWAECFVGKWVAIDPLMNQIPADATHVKLVEGDLNEQVILLKVIGQLQIEILAYH